MYSSEKNYQLSNFYLKISLFLNNKFLTNTALLAENFYYQKKFKLSQNIYESLKAVGPAHILGMLQKALLQFYLEKKEKNIPSAVWKKNLIYYQIQILNTIMN